ncbi:ferritin-like domain-containing protein [Adhaeribacter soli]|uniref:Ferritin-like domain-containing protein n=1 Tax=Adhaeribacter soli TaxID=2607655 RepID=A0A5N1IUS2_9BACT|nr:ferritin-like domain-containing protein [Adhaeribacter soli]KAA9333681.1 ferritin-like domain-containing protein [Adhaeribacter soli]
MFNKKNPDLETGSSLITALQRPLERRLFLKYAGATAAFTGLILSGCSNDDDDTTKPPTNNEVVDPANNPNATDAVNLGTGDVGILNYAYALEQLEAAFYTRVVAGFYSGASTAEQQILTDIRDHEVAHRNFFKDALTAAGATPIPELKVNFTSINFSDRGSVLATAKAFEDLGVAAYNGAGKLLQNKAYLLIAGKIVSVEARHAAVIRDLINNGSFADNSVIDANGLDRAMMPLDVISAADKYITTNINANNLPK